MYFKKLIYLGVVWPETCSKLLERSKFLVERNVLIFPKALHYLIQTWNREHIDVVVQGVSTNRILMMYEDFQENVRLGTLKNT